MRELSAILTIAYRDVIKLFRDRFRLLASLIFPVIFIGVLGGSLQQNIGSSLKYHYLTFVFIGVIAQTLFQSTAQGIISLIQDRENDFSQEIFVSPISRYSIIIGKLLGEGLVSVTQVFGIVIFGFIVGAHFNIIDIFKFIGPAVMIFLLGGSFGLLVLANASNERTAQQIFPFIIFPQFFLAGVFTPVQNSTGLLGFLTHIMPMTYAVDLLRGVFYYGKPEYPYVVLNNPLVDFVVVLAMFITFVVAGTYFFTRNERNR